MKIKFLIIRLSSIGDIVLTTPVIRMLKKQVDGAEIHFLVKQKFSLVLAPNPYIDKLHLFDGNLSETIHRIKAEKFHYIIDLHNNLRTFLIRTTLRLPSDSFHKLNWKKWLLVNTHLDYMPAVHIVDRYLATCQRFELKNDHQGLDFFTPADTIFPPEEYAPFFNQNFYSFVIGGQHFTKKMPNELIVRLINEIDLPVVLVGGNEDAENGNWIAQNTGRKTRNLCGKLHLYESALVVKNSQMLITHDTGMMHVAAAYRKKIITLWGNTVPEFGMSPYETESFHAQVQGLSCRPCSKIGHASCPKGHFKCMYNQDISIIALKARAMFG